MSLSGRVVGLLEDDLIMGESLVQRLALEGTVVRWWKTGREAIAELGKAKPEAVICDIRLPDMGGDEVFREMAATGGVPPFLFITAFGDIDHAVGLIRAGAGDYLTKPFEMPDFLERLQGILPEVAANEVGAPLGQSAGMRSVAQSLRRVAKVKTAVLLTGETGSGKEVCARFLHEAGGADRPFIAVNCAAIPNDLMEAELFGHEKGAFTGAQARHAGYAERAGKGTLFLDEISELSLALQSKLLRVLEERRFSRIGGEKVLEFEARVVCATNADLEKRVEAGSFREDLYYRINVLSIQVPPLRERPEDVMPLLEMFFDTYAPSFDADLRGISALVEEVALTHPWPGNVRELRNRVERAVALAAGPWLMPSDLFPERRPAEVEEDGQVPSLEATRDEAERKHILRVLGMTNNEMAQSAKLLGISRTTLWEKMRRLGLSSTTH
ncbi:MAG: sigma-54-dependent Fis family transcriptional regulator [Devosia sp.]|uniref:sigma-54-dependent transcriptional regulator n=1 Tax=Devosia sp. TaxID=1871048 RepID=UPI001ACBA252|nr:sigma-54 dependent transcriptional regulator [Devosia sp.]MBN9317860.1 sigma-54-dependent Fis family transcriptional regulator [Devosia sp.]